jgi:hypothetical protein
MKEDLKRDGFCALRIHPQRLSCLSGPPIAERRVGAATSINGCVLLDGVGAIRSARAEPSNTENLQAGETSRPPMTLRNGVELSYPLFRKALIIRFTLAL